MVHYPHRSVTLSVLTERYAHGGGLVVELIDVSDGMSYATASVNVAGVQLADDEFVFKTYSENEYLLDAMLEYGLVELTGRHAEAGFAGPQPICRLRAPDLRV